jgi:hypothetical protein
MQSVSQIHKMIDDRELLELRQTGNQTEQTKQGLAGLADSGLIGLVGTGCLPLPLYLVLKELFKDQMLDATFIFEELRATKSTLVL